MGLEKYKKVFLGQQHGIGLLSRGPNDDHVVFEVLSEDDENWFKSTSGSSAFWLADLEKVVKEARAWLEENTDTEKFGYRWRQ